MGSLPILEQEEKSLFRELKNEIDNLKELGKKVRVEGVKEGIDKVSRFFNFIVANKNEQRAAGLALTDSPCLASPTDNHGAITDAIEGLNKRLVNQEAVLNKLAEAIADKCDKGRDAGGQTSWSEVVKSKSKGIAESNSLKTAGYAPTAPLRKGIRIRPSAIIVDPKSGDFPELASKIKNGVDLELIGNAITRMRKAKNGGLLIEVRGGTSNLDTIRKEVARSVGSEAAVRALKQRGLIEVRDLDEWSSKEDLVDAVVREAGIEATDAKVISFRKGYGGVQMALVLLPLQATKKLADLGRIKVGLVCCRVRAHTNGKRCFRCLAFGHESRACAGPDRQNLCRRCGVSGHLAMDCDAPIEMANKFKITLTKESVVPRDHGAEEVNIPQC
jgi:hypothetical protein